MFWSKISVFISLKSATTVTPMRKLRCSRESCYIWEVEQVPWLSSYRLRFCSNFIYWDSRRGICLCGFYSLFNVSINSYYPPRTCIRCEKVFVLKYFFFKQDIPNQVISDNFKTFKSTEIYSYYHSHHGWLIFMKGVI